MTTIKTILVSCLALAAAFACDPSVADTTSSSHAVSSQNYTLDFDLKGRHLSAYEALVHLEVAMRRVPAMPVSGIFERGPTDKPRLMLETSYGSLAEFVEDMNGQDSQYIWETRQGGSVPIVFVYPRTDALLSKPLGSPLSFTKTGACTVLAKVAELVDPRPGHCGCGIRGNVRTVDDQGLKVIFEAKHTISLSASSTTRDALEAIINAGHTAFGLHLSSAWGTNKASWYVR
jgi:hypothetical protein